MSIADKFPWRGVEQQNDILGIHNLGHETGLVKFYDGLDDLPTMREAVNYGGFFDDLFGDINEVWKANERSIGEGNQILDGNGKPLPEPVPCRRGEPTDSNPSSSSGDEDAGSGEDGKVYGSDGKELPTEKEAKKYCYCYPDGKREVNINGKKVDQTFVPGKYGGWVNTAQLESSRNHQPDTTQKTPTWDDNKKIIEDSRTKIEELDAKIAREQLKRDTASKGKRLTDGEIRKFQKTIEGLHAELKREKDKKEKAREANKATQEGHIKKKIAEDATGLTPRDLGGGKTGYKPKPDPETITPTQQPVVDKPKEESQMTKNRKKLGRG